MPDKSFLGSIKDDITTAFAEQYDALAEVCSDAEVLTASLKTAQKKVWEIVEKRLKESYLNGRKAGDGKHTEAKKPNPFRKE